LFKPDGTLICPLERVFVLLAQTVFYLVLLVLFSYQHDVLGIADKSALARLAAGLREAEQCSSNVYPLVQKRCLGKLLEILINEPDYEWLMIDANHIKVHLHAAGARGGNQDMSKTKEGSTSKFIWLWMQMVCRSESLLQKVS
jgi:hypothetical protein